MSPLISLLDLLNSSTCPLAPPACSGRFRVFKFLFGRVLMVSDTSVGGLASSACHLDLQHTCTCNVNWLNAFLCSVFVSSMLACLHHPSTQSIDRIKVSVNFRCPLRPSARTPNMLKVLACPHESLACLLTHRYFRYISLRISVRSTIFFTV